MTDSEDHLGIRGLHPADQARFELRAEALGDLIPCRTQCLFVFQVQQDAADVTLVNQTAAAGFQGDRIADLPGSSGRIVRVSSKLLVHGRDTVSCHQCLDFVFGGKKR